AARADGAAGGGGGAARRPARRRRRGADGRGFARGRAVRIERHRGADVAPGEPGRASRTWAGRVLARAGPLRADLSRPARRTDGERAGDPVRELDRGRVTCLAVLVVA